MSRESCIQHRPNQRMAIVRTDYYELTLDPVTAALLNEFEFRANAALIDNESLPASVYVGVVLIKQLEAALIHLSSDKQIRTRLKWMESQGFISSRGANGKPKSYTVHIHEIQARLNNLGQTTAVNNPAPRSNNRAKPRSNDDLSIYKKDLLKDSSLEAHAAEEKTKIEQSEQANLNTPVEQQTEPLTSRLIPINSGEGQNIPPAAPQVENGMSTDKPKSQYAHPAQRMNEMFAGRGSGNPWNLPGRNNYDAGFVEHLRKYLRKFDVYKDGCTVYDAKRWVTKRNYTEQGIDEISLAWDEYQDSLKRKPASEQIAVTSPHVEPHEKPSPEAIAEFRRKREEAAREMQRRRMGA